MVQVAGAMSTVTFSKGTTIIAKGTEGTTFYMVKSGTIAFDLGDGAGFSKHRGSGEYFGEISLIQDHNTTTATAIAQTVTNICMPRHLPHPSVLANLKS